MHTLIEKTFGTTNAKALVVLSSCGNPDHDENPFKQRSPLQVKEIHTYMCATRYVEHYIKKHELGAGNWTGGAIYHREKGLIGKVSYNGRLWKVNEKRENAGAMTEAEIMTNI